MMNKSIKVITFDLDDTLWDVKPVLLNAERLTHDWLSQHASKLTATFTAEDLMERRWKLYQQQPDLCHQISQLRITALKLAMEDVGYSSQQAKTLSQKAFDFFLDARHQVTFYNTVEPLLENLKKEYSLGVLTNGNADIFRLEMGRFFDFSFSAEQLNASKPAADHFLAAQKVSGAIAAEVIHIGDHIEHDILAAQQAGCFSIWFNPEMKKPKDDIQATKQVQCLSEIPAAISAIKETLSAN